MQRELVTSLMSLTMVEFQIHICLNSEPELSFHAIDMYK